MAGYAQKGDIDPKTGHRYAENPNKGWIWDDQYWSEVQEPALKAAYMNTPAGLIQTVMDDYNKKFDEYTRKYNEFDKNNPFVFDKVLGEERAKVSQRLDPYYNQTLSDYLTGVDLQRKRGLEDERKILTEINQDVTKLTGQQQLEAQDAIDRSREGAVDAGLYTSGARLRAQGRIEEAQGRAEDQTLQTAERKTKDVQLTGERQKQDLGLQETRTRRDIEQERQYQTESQSLTEVDRLQKQRAFEQGQYAGVFPGNDPNRYQSSLYSLLGA